MTFPARDANSSVVQLLTGAETQALLQATRQPTMYDGSAWQNVRGDATSGLWTQDRARAVFFGLESISPLAANGIAFGASRSAGASPSPFAFFRAAVAADQASATNGMRIQTSFDGTNWIDTVFGTLSAGSVLILTASVIAPNYRLRVGNGTTAQTTLSAWTGFTAA